MKWQKLGQIYEFKYIDEFLKSHASNPLAIQLNCSVFRIFFSGRDDRNRSSVGYIDFDMDKLSVVGDCDSAIFRYSPDPNSFYSHGVSVGTDYLIGENRYILFMGWHIPEGQHWEGQIGRLKLSKDLNFLHHEGDEPFIGKSVFDPVSLSYPWVLKLEDKYKMWYGSTVTWRCENNEMLHVIKDAASVDGENWTPGEQAIESTIGTAQAFSRPTVIQYNSKYYMWFSYRSGNGEKYRIGYCVSGDGVNWSTPMPSSLTTSNDGWDAEMVCYPYVFKYKSELYMLYNGNDYGRFGFGLAVLR